MHPSRTFGVLMGAGVLLSLLLVTAAVHSLMASCPDGWSGSDLGCLLLPARGDAGVHLLSYTFMGMILVSMSSALILWRKQWAKTRSLSRDLATLYSSDDDVESWALRLGLKDKVHVLDSDEPLCFCAGFISPRIYVSRGMADKLTPEELEALLLHEKHHLENRDPLKALLGKLVVSAFFFIPAMKDVLNRYLIEKEIAADRSAIKYQGHVSGLAGALMTLVQDRYTAPAGLTAVGGTEALRHRIDHLMGNTPQHVYSIPVLRLVVSFLGAGLIIAAILAPLPGSHPVSSDMSSTISDVMVQEVTL